THHTAPTTFSCPFRSGQPGPGIDRHARTREAPGALPPALLPRGFCSPVCSPGAAETRQLLQQHQWQPPGVTLPEQAPADEKAIAGLIRVTGENFRVLDRLLAQIARAGDQPDGPSDRTGRGSRTQKPGHRHRVTRGKRIERRAWPWWSLAILSLPGA